MRAVTRTTVPVEGCVRGCHRGRQVAPAGSPWTSASWPSAKVTA